MQTEVRELTAQASRIEELLGEIESFPDPTIRRKAEEIVQGLLTLYGEGLARILSAIWDQDDRTASTQILDALIEDELVTHLLLLHDLHPVPVEERVQHALEQVRPYLESHGGNVELLKVDHGVAKLRLQGSCSGCPSSTATLKLAIEEAIRKAAPDLESIEAEGVVQPQSNPVAFISTADLLKPRPTPAGPRWTIVRDLPELATGGMHVTEISGSAALFFNLDGTFYAYRDACPQCNRSLGGGTVHGDEIICPDCNQQYDIRRAGRCRDMPDQHLEPIPLLVEDNVVKVALHV